MKSVKVIITVKALITNCGNITNDETDGEIKRC